MLTPPARWCLLEGTILIGWYRNGNRKNHPPTCKLRAGGFALCDRKSYECLSASFPAFYLVVSRKTREEAIAVLRDMVKRKKEMEAKAQIEFAKARKEAADCYASL